MPRGRPKKDTVELYVRVPSSYLALLVSTRPDLFKPAEPGVFRHGALSGYISRLILSDIRASRSSGNSSGPSE